MPLTNFPGGLSSMGAPVVPTPSLVPANGRTHYWVHGNNGSNGNDGLSADRPLLTMAKVFTLLKSGDVIHVNGNIREQLTSPAGVFGVTVIGESTRPRHPDSHTDGSDLLGSLGNGYSSALWKTPTVATTAPLLKVIQQGWRFVNMLFAGPTDSDCIQLYRDAGSGDDERDASHAEFIGCRFDSGYNAINDTGGCYNVLVRGCIFRALTNFCILGVGNIGAGQLAWHIHDNHFWGFTNGVKIAGVSCRIQNNTFTAGGTPNTTVVLNTDNGGGGSANFIVLNFFQTATANFNTPDVVGDATDVWWNYSIDSTAAGVGANMEVGQPA